VKVVFLITGIPFKHTELRTSLTMEPNRYSEIQEIEMANCFTNAVKHEVRTRENAIVDDLDY